MTLYISVIVFLKISVAYIHKSLLKQYEVILNWRVLIAVIILRYGLLSIAQVNLNFTM